MATVETVMHRITLSTLAVAVAVSCTPAGLAEWRSTIARGHPLVGRIWQPATGAFVTPQRVENAATQADIVLLGEKHDNLDHHLLQARLVRAMIRAGRRPAVVFEMIPEDRQPALDRWLSEHPFDAAGLSGAVDWDASGWPPWSTYRPIAEAALEASLPLRAGNVPKQIAKEIGRDGLSALDAARRTRLGLDGPPSEQAVTSMRRELFEAHCGLMPETTLDPLVNVQRTRDAVLADNIAKGLALANTDSAVLIAGGGHARSDYGAPMYLSWLAPGRSVLTIAFVEVADENTTPTAYEDRYQGSLPVDFVWFTPRANERDYCDELKRRRSMPGAGSASGWKMAARGPTGGGPQGADDVDQLRWFCDNRGMVRISVEIGQSFRKVDSQWVVWAVDSFNKNTKPVHVRLTRVDDPTTSITMSIDVLSDPRYWSVADP